jgi:hypothetical protein
LAVQLSSTREAEQRWRSSHLTVESSAVKKRVGCKSASVEKKNYMCRSYSETPIINVLKIRCQDTTSED